MRHTNLLNLPVFTQSNQSLGKISGFEIDPDSQSILRYYIKSGRLIKTLFKKLIIHRSQVISIDDKKMVVENAVASEKKKAESPVLGEEAVRMPV